MAEKAKIVRKSNSNRGSKPGERRGGRKKGSLNKATATVRELARKYAPGVIKRLGWLYQNAETETAQIAAGKEILDRAYGKSPQPMDGDGQGGAIQHALTVRFVKAGQ